MIDVEKSKAKESALNRGKKRQLKSNVAAAAWGKLVSQCSQVGFASYLKLSICLSLILVIG